MGVAAAVDFLRRYGSRTVALSRAAGELDGSLAGLERCSDRLGYGNDFRIS